MINYVKWNILYYNSSQGTEETKYLRAEFEDDYERQTQHDYECDKEKHRIERLTQANFVKDLLHHCDLGLDKPYLINTLNGCNLNVSQKQQIGQEIDIFWNENLKTWGYEDGKRFYSTIDSLFTPNNLIQTLDRSKKYKAVVRFPCVFVQNNYHLKFFDDYPLEVIQDTLISVRNEI